MATITVTVSGTTVMVGDGDTVKINIPGGGDVTIVADPTDEVDKVKIEFLDDTEADKVTIDLATFSEDDLHLDIKHYDPTDTINIKGAFNRYVDPDEVDEFTFDYIGSDGETYSGFVHAKDKGEKDFTAENPPIIICFAKGTLIETRSGWAAIEDLVVGDMVQTLDNGPMPLRWIGSTTVDTLGLTRSRNLRPIRVKRDAISKGLPSRDLFLSPNHRVLISGWRAELLFGESEVLVPIKSLVNDTDILIDHCSSSVTYFHLLFDGHQIVCADGLAAESLFIGSQSIEVLSDKNILEIEVLFGCIEEEKTKRFPAARPLIRVREGRALAA